jgi:hypothetical protein
MGGMLRIDIEADYAADIEIISGGNVVARVSGTDSAGFDRKKYLYNSSHVDRTSSSSYLYIPNFGHRIVFSSPTGEKNVNLNVRVATLTRDGFRECEGYYVSKSPDGSGHILTLDMTQGVTSKNIGNLRAAGKSSIPSAS